MKTLIISLTFFLASSGFILSQSKQKKIAGNYTNETECLGTEMDGTQTLRAWGEGKNRFDAIEQAKKNAVRDVIFNGIRSGKEECSPKPLVNEVNAREKYEDYFNAFFKDQGPFTEFVSMKDERKKIGAKERLKGTDGVEYGIIVQVKRSDLKSRLLKDNILKQQ